MNEWVSGVKCLTVLECVSVAVDAIYQECTSLLTVSATFHGAEVIDKQKGEDGGVNGRLIR